jgi:hypothetical protein
VHVNKYVYSYIGVTFTAKMVLDVNIYKEDSPMPESMLAVSTPDLIKSEDVRAYGKNLPLQRGVFPRPYSLTVRSFICTFHMYIYMGAYVHIYFILIFLILI